MKVFTLCFVGVSGSGKSTIANELIRKLKQKGMSIQLIDGDILREQLGNLFGYTKEERLKNSRVVRLLAKYLNDNGINTVVTIVAPYQMLREEFREFVGDSYIEIFIDCPLEVCSKRDPKGYYKKAKIGGMKNLNGMNDEFEKPISSEIIIQSNQETVEEAVSKIMAYLEENGYELSVYNK